MTLDKLLKIGYVIFSIVTYLWCRISVPLYMYPYVCADASAHLPLYNHGGKKLMLIISLEHYPLTQGLWLESRACTLASTLATQLPVDPTRLSAEAILTLVIILVRHMLYSLNNFLSPRERLKTLASAF